MTRVTAFTGGAHVPSARYRVRQFVEPLRRLGIDVSEHPSRFGTYPPAARWRRLAWLAGTVAARAPDVAASWRTDVAWMQREFVSTLQTLEWATRRPRVLDVDDALWLLPRGGFARRLAARCDRVVVGNSFLAEYFTPHARDLRVIPTAVDTDTLVPPAHRPHDAVTIGWSGSSSGFRYLEALDAPLAAVCHARSDVRILVMADRPPELRAVPADRLEFVHWSPSVEVPTLQRMDIGLMPLRDGMWERGKCSFKMLQYLACAAPVVVSPVGMNCEVLAQAEVGHAAVASAEWVDALVHLASHADERVRLGAAGRALVEARYSVQAIAPQLATVLGQW